MNAAFLFPGQGAQRPGMLHDLPAHPAVRDTLQETSEALGFDVLALDSEPALRSAAAVQLSLLAAGVAAARALIAEGAEPVAVTGLSVGAFAAAVVTGVLGYVDCLRLVHHRALLMERSFSDGYGMAAIVGLDEGQVAAIVARIHSPACPAFVSNINAPRQIVIAGACAAMDRVLEEALRQGARKAERLPVPVLSHCPLLQPVAEELKEMVRPMRIARPSIPCIGNVRARALRTGEAVVKDLVTNVAHGVRWHDSVSVLTELGCDLFIEMSPGRVLSSLATESFPAVRALAMEDYPLHYLRALAARTGRERPRDLP